MFCTIWQFDVQPGAEGAFLHHYAPDGSWARLFRRDPAYVETLLLRDPRVARRFLTIDRWTSEEAYQAFRARHADDYGALDNMCEVLTVEETPLGAYEEIGPRHS